MTPKEKKYFNLPPEQQIKQGIQSMERWITLIEAIFKKRGIARQTKLNTWLTERIPSKDWKSKYKKTNTSQTGGCGSCRKTYRP